MTQTKFADILGVSRGRVSQIMNDPADYKLSQFLKLAMAANKIPRIEFLSKDDFYMLECKEMEETTPLELCNDTMTFQLSLHSNPRSTDFTYDHSSAEKRIISWN